MTVYDGRPAADLEAAIAQLGDRAVTLRLGPDVDPASTWAGCRAGGHLALDHARLPDRPSRACGPRSRRSSRRGRRATPGARRSVSESDLFLRLCPAPTIGVTGTKGKTTTASLAHAILAADPLHPAILGGNIGTPLVERLPELTPDHRVVVELSELQLPALSRGTTVAVYTNVTSDHLDRHGSVEAYRRVKRRLAELVDPDGALVLNLEDPVVGGYAGLGTAPVVLYRDDRPVPGGLGVMDGWIVSAAVERLPLAGGGIAQAGPGGGIMPVDELGIPGRHNVSNALAAIAVGLLFGVAPDAIRRAAAAFTGVEHRLQSVGPRRWRPVRQRLPGHPAGRGDRGAARVPGAGGADRRRPGQGRGPPRARDASPGETAVGGGADRGERPRPRGPVPRRRPRRGRPARATHGRGGRRRGRLRAPRAWAMRPTAPSRPWS